METGKKVTIQSIIDDDLHDKLKQDAERESRKISPHVQHILKVHISEVEKEKPFVSKKQYEDPNN
jgi:hypothetical protein